MNTTAHKPYAKFSEDDIRPILGFVSDNNTPVSGQRLPLVPDEDGQKLVKATLVNGYNTEYEIIIPEDTKKQMLHG
jgi:hypothetical protein